MNILRFKSKMKSQSHITTKYARSYENEAIDAMNM